MKKWIKDNKKLLLYSGLSIIVLIVVLTVILVISMNEESTLSKFQNAIVGSIEKAKSLEVEEYKLINFPDTEEVISKSKKIKISTGKKYDEFKEGYIIIYKDGKYAFKLTNGVYCATKGYDDDEINIDVSGVCEDYEVEYKKEEN